MAITFQFQTGAIKSPMSVIARDLPRCGFNSKLVRLKVERALDKKSTGPCFNSKLVRLKAEYFAA